MRSVVVTMILGLSLGWSSVVDAQEMSVLNSVSTSVQGGRTRVAFQFAGDVRFSTEQAKNGVRIVFSRTRAASTPVLNRRLLNAGPLESIGFQRPAMDSIIAVLTFVNGSSYRCVCPASGNELYVEVNGSAAVRQPPAVKHAPVQPAPVVAAPPQPGPEQPRNTTGSSLIDIPGVAKMQMEHETETETVAGPSRAGEPARWTMPVLLAISILVSLAVTSVALMVVARMMRREPAPAPVVAVTPAPAVSIAAQLSAYQQASLLQEEEDEDDDMKPEPERIRALFNAPVREEEQDEDPGRETSLQLARTFRRGSEEITLARKFHERPSPALTPGKMQTAMARATTKGQRLTAARKLGVGRGEFDLAEKLKAMAQPPSKNGEGKA